MHEAGLLYLVISKPIDEKEFMKVDPYIQPFHNSYTVHCCLCIYVTVTMYVHNYGTFTNATYYTSCGYISSHSIYKDHIKQVYHVYNHVMLKEVHT